MTPSAPRSSSLPAGFEIGRYVVERRLARGGMAELYVASARGPFGFNKQCVLKLALPHLAEDSRFTSMFVHEARVASRLEHPNIAQILDVGSFEGGPYLAMQYVDGHDVRKIMRTLAGQPMDLAVALRITSCIAAGLAYAHAQTDEAGQPLGIVHRDVSPANVMVSFDGDVKLVDFGVAKSAVQDESTRDGVIKGKAAYLSPEQARGKPVDHRTDIFALGILLFETTTGRRLFRGDSDFETLRMIVDGDHPTPHDVCDDYPPELTAIVMKALAVDPGARYSSADALRRDLQVFARRFDVLGSELDIAAMMETLFGGPASKGMDGAATNAVAPVVIPTGAESSTSATGMHAPDPTSTELRSEPYDSLASGQHTEISGPIHGDTVVASTNPATQVAMTPLAAPSPPSSAKRFVAVVGVGAIVGAMGLAWSIAGESPREGRVDAAPTRTVAPAEVEPAAPAARPGVVEEPPAEPEPSPTTPEEPAVAAAEPPTEDDVVIEDTPPPKKRRRKKPRKSPKKRNADSKDPDRLDSMYP